MSTPRNRDTTIADGKIQFTIADDHDIALISSHRRSNTQTNENTLWDNKKGSLKKSSDVAPSYIKFYKFEEMKKNFQLQNRRDRMRHKLA